MPSYFMWHESLKEQMATTDNDLQLACEKLDCKKHERMYNIEKD